MTMWKPACRQAGVKMRLPGLWNADFDDCDDVR